MSSENMCLCDYDEDELFYYLNVIIDIEYKFLFGWGELWGIVSCIDFDLCKYVEYFGEDFRYYDLEMNEKYILYCIELLFGVDCVILVFLCDVYDEEGVEGSKDVCIVLYFYFVLVLYKVVILFLSKKLFGEVIKIFE